MSRCEEEFDGHRRGGREKEEARKRKRRRKKRGRKKGLKEEAEKGKKEEEKEEERNHFPSSLSKSSSVFAQCVNESSVKPFLFRKSNIYACSTDAFKGHCVLSRSQTGEPVLRFGNGTSRVAQRGY